MDKYSSDIAKSEKAMEWIFPPIEVHYSAHHDQYEEQKALAKRAEEKRQEEVLLQQKQMLADAQKLKDEYSHKIKIINNMMSKLQEPLSFIDDNLVDLLNLIIKKIVKNIIYREISNEPKIIHDMILDLKELLHEKNGLLTAYLSEVDQNLINKDELTVGLAIKIDPKLASGDVIIKSNSGEIQALLDDRLNKILGIKND